MRFVSQILLYNVYRYKVQGLIKNGHPLLTFCSPFAHFARWCISVFGHHPQLFSHKQLFSAKGVFTLRVLCASQSTRARPAAAVLRSWSTTDISHVAWHNSATLSSKPHSRPRNSPFITSPWLSTVPKLQVYTWIDFFQPQVHNTCAFLPCDAMRSTVLVIVILSVRPSVRLSHSCTVSTWFELRSWFLHHMVAPSF